ncbi:GNAT family N-acetyltransferase [Pseudomonas typographi]|uniref:GNAT family N-acetyltransferase n=1 Tax=Pseudomonas typographi TaxID=2715964 RepID=UPI00168A093C|nr:GNAT family N-acetyltransferase [Pseudomonas typographi]MBD1587799.1 GNAT family N-acetyltransferase [Pseudomonas typographi]
MDALPTFTTARLLLTPLQLADAPAIQQLFPHWEVVRYLDSRVPWPYPADGALAFVRDHALPAIERGEERHWMIRLAAEPQQCIGSIGLYEYPGNNRGFWLAPAWQGRGYIREACEVINHHWFATLGRPLLHVPKAEANLASKRVSEREGMRLVRVEEGRFVAGPIFKEIWELRREQWLIGRLPSAAPPL